MSEHEYESFKFNQGSQADCDTLNALLKGLEITVYGSLYENGELIGRLSTEHNPGHAGYWVLLLY